MVLEITVNLFYRCGRHLYVRFVQHFCLVMSCFHIAPSRTLGSSLGLGEKRALRFLKTFRYLTLLRPRIFVNRSDFQQEDHFETSVSWVFYRRSLQTIAGVVFHCCIVNSLLVSMSAVLSLVFTMNANGIVKMKLIEEPIRITRRVRNT